MSDRKDQVAEVRSRINIVDVIHRVTPLKKKGQRHMGLCPFHNEKTPSFSVNEDKGLYYCFGCQAGGDVFDFVMRYEGLDFKETLRRLADEAGVALEAESPQRKQQKQAETEVDATNRMAHRFFIAQWERPEAQAARAYLEQRGLPWALAQRAGLGFGGPSGLFLRHAAEQKIELATLEKAGLLSEEGNRALFDQRLIFPVYDERQRLCGFGGRRLDGEKFAKYVNSRENILFRKSRLLFGLQGALPHIRKQKRVILCEGFLDVLACHQAGLPEAVAALGTAFTEHHAETLARFVKDAVLCFDGDAAGLAATQKAALKLARAKVRATWARLPDGDDPDSYLKNHGQEALVKVVNEAPPVVEALMETAFLNCTTIEEKSDAAGSLWPLVQALPTGLERELYGAKLAERVGISYPQLERHLNQTRRPQPKRVPPSPKNDAPPSPISAEAPPPPAMTAMEAEVLKELLLYPEKRESWGDVAEFAVSETVVRFLDRATDLSLDLPKLIEEAGFPPRLAVRLQRIEPASRTADPSDDLDAAGNRTLSDALKRLKRYHLDGLLKNVIDELRDAEGERAMELLRQKRDLNARRRAL